MQTSSKPSIIPSRDCYFIGHLFNPEGLYTGAYKVPLTTTLFQTFGGRNIGFNHVQMLIHWTIFGGATSRTRSMLLCTQILSR
uniref:Uncharacterized protein n=1 Tax=Lepeophtheirus salmonis TaxID=72036 RepID=A0A0K2TT77_LEPSM